MYVAILDNGPVVVVYNEDCIVDTTTAKQYAGDMRNGHKQVVLVAAQDSVTVQALTNVMKRTPFYNEFCGYLDRLYKKILTEGE